MTDASPLCDTEIVSALAGLTVGDYACFAHQLAGPDDPRPAVVADRLLDAGMRAAIDDRFARKFDDFDRRAVHSIWMKWYLNTFIPPVLLADLLLMRTVPVALDHVAFIVGDDTRIAAVKILRPARDSAGADMFDRFEALIFDHFAPLIELWSARTDVTRRVYWSNVGNTFEAMLQRVESVSGQSERLRQARQLLAEPLWRDGRPNPIHDAVYSTDAAPPYHRRRRICCLQYLLPDRRFCKACPIEEAHAAGAPPEPT